MEVIIRGMRREGKTSLAALVAGFLETVGHVVIVTEDDGRGRPRSWFQHVGTIDYRLDQSNVRNVEIRVEQPTQEIWDGRIVVDHAAMEAEVTHRRVNPNFYPGGEGEA